MVDSLATRQKQDTTPETDFLILLLLQIVQTLSILPALIGVVLCVGAIWSKEENREDWLTGSSNLSRAELLLTSTWAILSGYHSYCLARGLNIRWLTFYSLTSTFLRSLGIQAFAFPLTHFSLTVICHAKPLLGWQLCGLTALFSDCIKSWVVSNLKGLLLRGPKTRKRELLKQRKEKDVLMLGNGNGESKRMVIQVHKREWQWELVLRKCAPTGLLLLVSNMVLLYALEETRRKGEK